MKSVRSKINWQKGLFRIYILWSFLTLGLCIFLYNGFKTDLNTNAKELKRSAYEIVRRFQEDHARWIGVLDWDEKAKKYSDPAWCMNQERLFTNREWCQKQAEVIKDEILRLKEKKKLFNEDNLIMHERIRLLRPGMIVFEHEIAIRKEMYNRFISGEWCKLQTQRFATRGWLDRQARAAKEYANTIVAELSKAKKYEENATIISIKRAFVIFVALATFPWIIHFSIKWLVRWLVSGFRHKDDAEQNTGADS